MTNTTDHRIQKTMVSIVEYEQGDRLGFATISYSTHFTGQRQAHIGELAPDETAEGRRVGTVLVEACEQWAREQGISQRYPH